jgi:hypothetical protein
MQIKKRISKMLPFAYPTSADEWQNIGLGLTVVAFTIAFALAAGSALLNWKINKTKREESRTKDEKIALEFKAKEVLIANADARAAGANERAAAANAEAGKANENAGKAHERAAKLESDNLALRSDLNKAAGEVATLQKAAADARAELARVQTALAA